MYDKAHYKKKKLASNSTLKKTNIMVLGPMFQGK